LLGAMTARTKAQVVRLAALYALADNSSVVDVPHLKAALALWRYCFNWAAFLFGDRLGDATADEILSALRRAYPDSLTRSEISRGLFNRNTSAAEIDRALDVLVDARLARCEIVAEGDGRPTQRWWYCEVDETDDINDISEPVPPTNVVNVVGSESDDVDVI
jgi:hypothetical protein